MSDNAPTTNPNTAAADSTTGQDGARRTSGMFGNLEQYKRGEESKHSVRRESLNEQTTTGGKSIIGDAFNSVFKGGKQ